MFGLFKKKPSPQQPDRSSIVPRIKHLDFLAAISAMNPPPDSVPVTEPLVADLLITYAFDLPEAFQMFTVADQRRLGLSLDELRSVAIDNLKRQIGEVKRAGEPPVIQLVVGDNLEACLLLVDGIWDTLATHMPPEIVVAVPTRDILLITTTQSTRGGLQLIRQTATEARQAESTHGLSEHLLVRRSNRWEAYNESA